MALPSSRHVSPRSTADAGGREVFGLDRPLLPKALAIRDWLLTEAAQLADSGQILPGFAERLIVLGIPIDRQRAPRHRQARGAAAQAAQTKAGSNTPQSNLVETFTKLCLTHTGLAGCVPTDTLAERRYQNGTGRR